MPNRPAGRLVLALVAIVSLLLSACTQGSSPAGPNGGAPTTRLTIGATASPPTLDPTANDAAAIPQVMGMTYADARDALPDRH